MKTLLLALFTVIIVAACQKTIRVGEPIFFAYAKMNHYAYRWQSDGTALVWARSEADLKDALVKIGCPCALDPSGSVYVVKPIAVSKTGIKPTGIKGKK
jgi:hypothetical protein